MNASKSTAVGIIGIALFLFALPSALSAQDADGRSLVEKSGSWESYVIQEGDYNSAVYEVALTAQSPKAPYSLVVGRLYPDCDRAAITYHLAPAAEEEINQGNLKGAMKVGEQSFEVTYRLESTGDGVFTIKFTNFSPELITAMLEAPSAEISLPNLDDFLTTVSLAGFPEAWTRTGPLCENGEGLRLY